MKQDIDNLLATSFIQPMEEATWLPPIVVVPKKNGKLQIYVDFKVEFNNKEGSFSITVHKLSTKHNGKM